MMDDGINVRKKVLAEMGESNKVVTKKKKIKKQEING